MRLAACALSAVLLSGCSWLGMGGGYGDSYGYDNYGYGSGYAVQGQSAHSTRCMPVQTQAVVAAPGCAPGYGYSVSSSAHSAGAGHYGADAGQYAMSGGQYAGGGSHGHSAMQGTGGYAAGGSYGGSTVLSSQAPYGAAVGGQYGAGSVQTVQGSPMYVTGPAGAYYGGNNMGLRGPSGGAGCCGGGGGMPFGLELGIGTEFGVDGDIFPGEVSKPFLGGPGSVSDIPSVSYNDAFKRGVHYEAAATYDLNRNTTLIGQVGLSESSGQTVELGTVDDGAGTSETLYGEFSDLKQVRVEGGFRRYLSGNGYSHSNMRPYFGATAGAVKTDDVTLTQSSATLVDPALFTQTYIDGGWSPTASGVVGAEWAVGNRSAIGVETGIRWADDLDTNISSSDRWSIPVKLRGRVSF